MLVGGEIVSAGVCDSKAVARDDKKDWEKKSLAHTCVIHQATRNGRLQASTPSQRYLAEN